MLCEGFFVIRWPTCAGANSFHWTHCDSWIIIGELNTSCWCLCILCTFFSISESAYHAVRVRYLLHPCSSHVNRDWAWTSYGYCVSQRAINLLKTLSDSPPCRDVKKEHLLYSLHALLRQERLWSLSTKLSQSTCSFSLCSDGAMVGARSQASRTVTLVQCHTRSLDRE